MDPLMLARLMVLIFLLALGWQGLFDTFPWGFGPWCFGRFIVWLTRDGLHWRRGHRVYECYICRQTYGPEYGGVVEPAHRWICNECLKGMVIP